MLFKCNQYFSSLTIVSDILFWQILVPPSPKVIKLEDTAGDSDTEYNTEKTLTDSPVETRLDSVVALETKTDEKVP